MTFHIVTLFPHAFDSYLGESILKRAIDDKKIQVKFYNPRDYARPNRATPSGSDALGAKRGFSGGAVRIDKKPYGGGPGMVIQAEPVIRAVEATLKDLRFKIKDLSKKKLNAKRYPPAGGLNAPKIIWLTPNGKQFTNETGIKLAKCSDLIIICGRYEGIDARVKQAERAMRVSHPSSASSPLKRGGGRWGDSARVRLEEISVGPFVLTGGELPAMILIDVIARQVEGVLGDFNSREEARVASPDVYTRPEMFEWKGKRYKVPKILLTGHHAKIDEWRQSQKKK